MKQAARMGKGWFGGSDSSVAGASLGGAGRGPSPPAAHRSLGRTGQSRCGARAAPCRRSRPSAVRAVGASTESKAGGGDGARSYRFIPVVLTDYWKEQGRKPGIARLSRHCISSSWPRRCPRSREAKESRAGGVGLSTGGGAGGRGGTSIPSRLLRPLPASGRCFFLHPGSFLTDVVSCRRSLRWGF